MSGRVINARSFYFNDGDRDYLTDCHRLIGMNRTTNFIIRDRFDFWNKYSPIDWVDYKDKIYYPRSWYSFEDLCLSRAEELLSLDDYVNVFYSGGTDSITAFVSLNEMCKDKKQLRVILNDDSINEFPRFYEFVKSTGCQIVNCGNNLVKKAYEIGGINVDGEGDQVLGYTGQMFTNTEYKDCPVEEGLWKIFRDEKLNLKIKNQTDEFVSLVLEYANMFNVNVTKIKHLMAIMTYGIRYGFFTRRKDYDFGIFNNKIGKTIGYSFYGSPFFEQWFISNFDYLFDIDQSTWPNFKKPAKDLIVKYSGVKEIYVQPKIGSWVHYRYCPLMKEKILVHTVDGYEIYDNCGLDEGKNRYHPRDFSLLVREKYLK